jgi:hypothetical protein
MEVEAVPYAEGCHHSPTGKGKYGKFPLFHVLLVTKLPNCSQSKEQSEVYLHCTPTVGIHWCHLKRQRKGMFRFWKELWF